MTDEEDALRRAKNADYNARYREKRRQQLGKEPRPKLTPEQRAERARERARESARRQRERNPEKFREARIKWRAANAEKQKARTDAWRAANPEKVRTQRNAWRAANRQKHRDNEKRRRERMGEKLRCRYRELYLLNHEARRASGNAANSRYRATHREQIQAAERARYHRDKGKEVRSASRAALRGSMGHDHAVTIAELRRHAQLQQKIFIMADAALPRRMDPDDRRGAIAEVALAVLEGRLKIADIPKRAAGYVAAYRKAVSVYTRFSLDSNIPGTDLTGLDSLEYGEGAGFAAPDVDPGPDDDLAYEDFGELLE